MSAKESGQRIFIWLIVIAFVVSSLGFTGLVIWELTRDKSSDSSSEAQQSQQNEEGKLKGTKLENYQPVAEVDKLKIIDVKKGDGKVVPKGATVTAHYT